MRPLGPEDIFSPPKFSFLVIARGPGFDFSRAFFWPKCIRILEQLQAPPHTLEGEQAHTLAA